MLEPDFIDVKLAPGQGATEMKFVSLLPPQLDIVFSFDLTGSMNSTINTAKANAQALIEKLDTLGIDINYGVMSYMDYPHHYDSYGYSATYGEAGSGDYAYKKDLSITSDRTAVVNAITSLVLGYGADSPQDYTRIFYESYADTTIGWRDGSKRILLNFADAVPHDDNLNDGVPGKTGEYSTGGDPGRDEIMFTPDDLDLQTVLAEMAANQIILLEAHASTSNLEYWDYWSSITGGQTFHLDPANIVEEVYNAIVSTVASVTDLHLIASDGFENWIESVFAASFTGTTLDPIEFLLRLRVPVNTADGLYRFIIFAVDEIGTIYGQQLVEIEVITLKAGGSIDIEYIDPQEFFTEDNDHDPCKYPIYKYDRCNHSHEPKHYCKYIYPVRLTMGNPGTSDVLPEGIYHTLINAQNTSNFIVHVKIKISIPAISGSPPVITESKEFALYPFEVLQISGQDINEILASTPYYNASFSNGTVLIICEAKALSVTAVYTFYQTNFHV